ncbi:hypothetical protein MTP99_015576 [Tenebrio molitor]|nr:hypothetical protein MTP99_015576 [Tenebrio molitor]
MPGLKPYKNPPVMAVAVRQRRLDAAAALRRETAAAESACPAKSPAFACRIQNRLVMSSWTVAQAPWSRRVKYLGGRNHSRTSSDTMNPKPA